MKNPNVSKEAKESAEERLKSMEKGDGSGNHDSSEKNPHHVVGGLKA